MSEAGESRHSEALARARELAESVLAPRAAESDRSDSPPLQNIRALASAGLMGLTTPVEFGGIGVPSRTLRAYTEILASACGVTNFVQGQHQSAALIIAGGRNHALKACVLPLMARGESLCGVAFSHLRRTGEPVLRAEPRPGGYALRGLAPWVTGWGVMDRLVLGGTLPDGRLLWAVAPLEESEFQRPSPPMRLCAMNASVTVTVEYRDLFVPEESVIKIITREELARNDLAAILAVTPQPFGVTRASLRLLESLHRSRPRAPVRRAAHAIERGLAELRQQADNWIERTTDPDYKATALSIRARAIRLGVRAAHTAVAASGGGANTLDHPAQRLFREAMFYTLTAQTPDVQGATLGLLAEEQA